MPTVRQRTLTSRDRELDHLAPFGEKDVEHHRLVIISAHVSFLEKQQCLLNRFTFIAN